MAGSPNSKKAISLSNLQKFKELCDQTYAKTGGGSGGGGGGTQLYMHTITNVTSNGGDIIYIVSPEAAQYTGMGLLFTAVCIYGGQYRNARGDTIGTIFASQYDGQYNFAVFNGSSFSAISVSGSKTYKDTVTPL